VLKEVKNKPVLVIKDLTNVVHAKNTLQEMLEIF
jgi:hypothetical protein